MKMLKRCLAVMLSLFSAISMAVAEGTMYVKYSGIGTNESETTFGEIPYNTKVYNGSGQIAMFLIPVNYTTEGEYTQFELKASTNNFANGISEDVRLQFYAQSEIADIGGMQDESVSPPRYSTTYDKMWLFVCPSYGSEDVRRYKFIRNTLPVMGWTNHLTTVCVLVDTTCLMRHPETNGGWLFEGNGDLMWCWHRYRYNDGATERETENGHGLWRPIAPVRWFTELPNWARSQITQ